MSGTMDIAVNRRALLGNAALAAAIALGAAYVAAELRFAANKPMWLDEWYAMTSVMRSQGFARLVLHGAAGQGSPAPLDFLLVKALDAARAGVRYLGLSPHAYFRLVGVLSTLGAALFVFFATLAGAGRSPTAETRATSGLFAFVAFASFILQPLVVYYAVETRPYALWAALSLVSAVSLLRPGRRARVVSLIALVLLGMTATASIFQIAALALAMLGVALARGNRLAGASREVLALFALPLAVSLFYCLRSQTWDYPAEMCAWARFLPFWAARAWVPAAAALAAFLCFRREETRDYAVPSLGILIVYLMAPGIFWLTKTRGMFFAEKQYIYHAATLPVVVATVAFVLSRYGDSVQRRARALVAASAAVILVLGATYTVGCKAGVAMRGWQEWRRGTGIPSDPSGLLSGLLTHELPRSFCLSNPATHVAVGNVRLVAEWLPVRYAGTPAGAATVLLEARGDGSEVKALTGICDSATPIPVDGGRR
jgi:hypothetical protein